MKSNFRPFLTEQGKYFRSNGHAEEVENASVYILNGSLTHFYKLKRTTTGIILAPDFCERKNPIWTKTVRDF